MCVLLLSPLTLGAPCTYVILCTVTSLGRTPGIVEAMLVIKYPSTNVFLITDMSRPFIVVTLLNDIVLNVPVPVSGVTVVGVPVG